MLVELPRLVICRLENCGATHGCLGRRDEREVFPGDSKQDLPVQTKSAMNLHRSRARDASYIMRENSEMAGQKRVDLEGCRVADE